MTNRSLAATLMAVLLLLAGSGWAGEMVEIPGGTYEPFYPIQGEGPITLEPFAIQATPVTNAQFLRFVLANPEWQRSSVPAIFADGRYLHHWASDTGLGSAAPNAPVTNVSWFAANAYCAAGGMRLPDEAEWEFLAWASASERDARRSPGRQEQLLAAYAARPGTPGAVGRGEPNAWGVHDMHELVWEWVMDFDSNLAKGDSRNSGDRDLMLFCGGAALGAADRTDYATFMRLAFRSGLDPAATASTLGFRCAGEGGVE